ncbi:RTA1 like protein-domain-containing protein [Mycena leptocephala]|nr:RTA1 like protein-domain-containing protein [Mycena leptocephala]
MSFIFRALVALAVAATTLASNPAVLESRADSKATRVFRGLDDEASHAGGYVPKPALALLGVALFGLSGSIHWIRMTAMAAGFALRYVFAQSPESIGMYVIMDLPCFFLATDYMLLARLSFTFDQQVSERCLVIKASRLATLFVCSDVITFLLQAAGGGLMSSASGAKLGNTIIMVGLVLQFVSFAIFTCVLLFFGYRMRREYSQYWFPQTSALSFNIFSTAPINDWRILFYVMCVTCIGLGIRSIFRIAEFAGGFNGYITTHEAYFYLFDSLPLWISMTLYCVVWPKRCLNNYKTSGATIALRGIDQKL